MTGDRKQRVKQLRRQLANLQHAAASASGDTESVGSQARLNGQDSGLEKSTQAELDDLLAGECPFCGSLSIRYVRLILLRYCEMGKPVCGQRR